MRKIAAVAAEAYCRPAGVYIERRAGNIRGRPRRTECQNRTNAAWAPWSSSGARDASSPEPKNNYAHVRAVAFSSVSRACPANQHVAATCPRPSQFQHCPSYVVPRNSKRTAPRRRRRRTALSPFEQPEKRTLSAVPYISVILYIFHIVAYLIAMLAFRNIILSGWDWPHCVIRRETTSVTQRVSTRPAKK